MVILVFFGVLPHPAQKLMSFFRANSRILRFSCLHRMLAQSAHRSRPPILLTHRGVFVADFCGGILVVLRWCLCGGILMVVWWCFCSGVVVFPARERLCSIMC